MRTHAQVKDIALGRTGTVTLVPVIPLSLFHPYPCVICTLNSYITWPLPPSLTLLHACLAINVPGPSQC